MPTGKKPPAKGKAKPKSPAAKIKRGLKGAVAYAKGDKAKATVRQKRANALTVNKSGPASLYKGEETISDTIMCIQIGMTNEQIAEYLGIGVSTLYEWKANISEFADALARARTRRTGRVINSLLTRAEGGVVEEQQAIKVKMKGGGEKVEVVTVKKYVPPDTAAIALWLHNREREHWKQFKAHEHSGLGGGPIQHEVPDSDKIVAAIEKFTEILK
jgi:hypothetical protein